MLTEYTTYEDVRAALGVSEEELADATLELQTFLTLLEEDLIEVNAAVPTAWLALPEDPATDTALEKRFRALVRLYSTYDVAFRLLDPAQMFGYLKVADGRASVERTADAFKDLRTNVAAMRTSVKALLLGALLALVPSASVPTPSVLSYVSGVAGSSDPVTGI
jgi:hypothetical protein